MALENIQIQTNQTRSSKTTRHTKKKLKERNGVTAFSFYPMGRKKKRGWRKEKATPPRGITTMREKQQGRKKTTACSESPCLSVQWNATCALFIECARVCLYVSQLLSAARFPLVEHQPGSDDEEDEQEDSPRGGGVKLKGTAVCCGSVKLPFVSVQAGRPATCASSAFGSLPLLHFCVPPHPHVNKRACF